ncbi:MAG: hypothetical protein INR65_16305, partial [Gluconacetobacter diazotrophicus]|nr:hypothetical protein [Gluconacetobacter diazotrophicus]
MISAYQRQRSVSGGLELFPDAAPSTYLTGTGSYQVQESPTFTFQPVTGEQFAQSFLRPLSPEELLSLAASGMPIDVLFRLGVQAVNRLHNDRALQGNEYGASLGFFQLIH